MRVVRSLGVLAAILVALWWVPAGGGSLPLLGAGPSTATVPFTPDDLPNLFAWYEADRGVYTDTGCSTPAGNTDAIACWEDLGPNGYDLLQATSGNRPTYLTTGMNSGPAVDFNAVDDECMLTATNTVTPGTGTDATGVVVVEMDAGTDAFARVTSYAGAFRNDSDSDSIIIARRVNTNDELESYRGGQVGVQTFTTGTARSFSVVYDGANGTTRVDNASAQTTANTNAFSETGVIGAGADIVNNQVCGTNYLDGRICLIIYTTSELTSGELASVQSYADAECRL